tara:strand:+ start:70 stop:273 length:204 start_codon:yes stop_codon:yes gene_type:complete
MPQKSQEARQTEVNELVRTLHIMRVQLAKNPVLLGALRTFVDDGASVIADVWVPDWNLSYPIRLKKR